MTENRYFYAVGRRKTASAQVRLYPEGTGQITVNGKPLDVYFTRIQDLLDVTAPLRYTGHEEHFDITVVVRGGGVTGQAGAIKHGIARALLKYDESLRPLLRRGGFLTRDPRMKERKKPGLKRARKAPTYTKR
ncbi:MAG: 30S ribosomal protein S9 [Ardenticatenia bacterium]|nr:30S ribosomal protein S9 [Ardenticatenia bacterium]